MVLAVAGACGLGLGLAAGFGFTGAFLAGAFHAGYSPCSFLNFSKSCCCVVLGLSLKVQLIAAFSR